MAKKKKDKYHFDEDYPIVIKHKDFMFMWCCDCGLRHVHFAEIERGKKSEDDKVNLYLIRDDHATNYRKDYERLKKNVKIMPHKGKIPYKSKKGHKRRKK